MTKVKSEIRSLRSKISYLRKRRWIACDGADDSVGLLMVSLENRLSKIEKGGK